MKPSVLKSIGVVLFAALPLAGCGAEAPDCGSTTVKNLILDSIKNNNNNLLAGMLSTDQIIDITPMENVVNVQRPYEGEACKDYPDFCKAADEFISLAKYSYAEMDGTSISKLCKKPSNEKNDNDCIDYKYANGRIKELKVVMHGVIAKISSSIRSDRDNAVANGAYELNDIVTTDKNATTGSVACKARLRLTTKNWGGAEVHIVYQVNKTSESKLIVENLMVEY